MLIFVAMASALQPAGSCCLGMARFVSDPAFIAAHIAPLPFHFASRQGRTVTYPTSGDATSSAYFVPPKAGVRTAVVMVHEWWGLNDYIKHEAVSLHDRTGYAVLALDLYNGHVAANPQEAGKLMGAVNNDRATEQAKGAVDALVDGRFGPKFNRIGAIGWCFGGGWSLRTAIQGGPHVQACVMYYGLPDDDPKDLARLHAPVLLMEAMKDGWITPNVVAQFKTAMASAHKSLTVRTYDDVHAFANPSNPKYDKASAEDAMAATLRFFREHLG